MSSFPMMPILIVAVSSLIGILLGWLIRATLEGGELKKSQEKAHALSLELFEASRERDDVRARFDVEAHELEKADERYDLLKNDRDRLELRLALLLRGSKVESHPGWQPAPTRGLTAPQTDAAGESELSATGPQVRVRRSTIGWWRRERPSAYPLERIGEIEPSNAERLHELGISTTYDLLVKAMEADDRRRLAKEIDRPDVTESVVQSWAQRCDLMRIPGVTSPRAGLLLANGVPSVKALASVEPEVLRSQLETLPSISLDDLPGMTELTGWIEAAQTLEP